MEKKTAQTAYAPDAELDEVNQPGLGKLREVVANHLKRRLPSDFSLRKDVLAGVSNAMSNVPDGMANGVLVHVNPVYGLYAVMVGPAVGGLFSSTQLMIITTTAAASLSTSEALGGLTGQARVDSLYLLVILTGVFQVAFGLLRLGRLIRFVSYSVTTGFLSGVSVLLILNQLPAVAGREAEGGNRIAQTFNLLLHLGDIDLWSPALAITTLLLAVLLPRTRLGNLGKLLAIVLPSVPVALLGLNGVQMVGDVGEIPRGLPLPSLPSLSGLSFDLVTGALAVAVVILVQGSGVSQSVPNPDGAQRSASRDFIAQGAANFVSGLFRGLPVGGSNSATALNVIYGARSRWAAILAGVCVALIAMFAPTLLAHIAIPALGALLILAGASSLHPRDIRLVWQVGWPARMAGIVTFLATLLLSIQEAVGIGVALSALLYLNRSSTDISLLQLVVRPDGQVEERKAPKHLPSGEVTVLDVYGNLFYAGAHTLERLLPSPQDVRNPVVILRLRGLSIVGATLLEVLAKYADNLEEADGRLYLSGLSKRVREQIMGTGKLDLSGPVRIYKATSIRGEATREAIADARLWLAGRSKHDTTKNKIKRE